MAKNQSSLVSTNDVNGIYSVSDFLNYIPDQLSFSDNQSFPHLKLFSNKKGIDEPIQKKIKSVLQLLDTFYFPTLIQFWAPKIFSTHQFLETFDFPFGISILRKGLCWYRKKCLNYKYSVDCGSNEEEEEEIGPVGRVFQNGFPEFSPDVSFYYSKEYKLRDFGVFCGVQGYLALPVFESDGQKCLGVLELLSIFDGSYSLTDKIGKVDEALKTVGLRTSKTCSPFDMERNQSSEHDFALTEIKKVLETACSKHKLPFAQAWFSRKGKNCNGEFLCTSEKGSYVLSKSISSFQKECIRLCLKKGQNVVWRAFTSGTSCFCKDIKQLRTTEYSLVNVARKCHLTSCIAICLQSTDTGSHMYVLEFFLPSIQIDRELEPFLNSLLATVKKLSPSFVVAAGQKLGEELSVEVDSFKISPKPGSPKNEEPFSSESNGRNFLSKEGNTRQIKVVGSHCSAGKCPNPSSKTPISPCNSKDLHKRKADYSIKASSNKGKTDNSLSDQDERVIIKATHEENIIKFWFSPTSGMRDFEHEVEKRLEIKAGTYEIKHVNDDNRRISLVNDAQLHDFIRTMISQKKTTVKLVLEPVKIQESASPLPQTSEMENENETLMFVKITHEDDTIKFQLSLSARMMELKSEVMKRIKLKDTDSFGIKYLSEENKWIPIESDIDLQRYLSNMRSKEMTTVRFSLCLITN